MTTAIVPITVTKSKLTNRGYTIHKDEIDSKVLYKLKKDLLVIPFVPDEYKKDTSAYPVYLESPTKLYLPKFYGIATFGPPVKYNLHDGHDINLEFNGNLRPLQLEVIETYKKTCTEHYGGGTICLRAGGGKTVVALKLICELKKKTLVVVNKEFLLNQWMERIKTFIPEANIGKIQQSVIDITNKDIVIAMLHSLSMKQYDNEQFNSFGLTIVDECHHISSEIFSRALPKISSKYTVGLSATPDRKDGLSKVFYWYLGPLIYKNKKNDTINLVNVQVIKYKNEDDEKYSRVEINYSGSLSYAKMINNICGCLDRTKVGINLLIDILSNEPTRKILILSERREHLKTMYKLLEEYEYTVGYYVGGMKQKDLDVSETKQIILGTFSMSSEALDIPALNTLLLMSPKSDIEQTVGRILRKKHDVVPLIIDIVDIFGPFQRQYYKRYQYYKKNKYIFI